MLDFKERFAFFKIRTLDSIEFTLNFMILQMLIIQDLFARRAKYALNFQIIKLLPDVFVSWLSIQFLTSDWASYSFILLVLSMYVIIYALFTKRSIAL